MIHTENWAYIQQQQEIEKKNTLCVWIYLICKLLLRYMELFESFNFATTEKDNGRDYSGICFSGFRSVER